MNIKMLPTPWLLLSWFRTYKWLFLLFSCQCVPGRMVIANRLTHRTRFLEDNIFRSGIEKRTPLISSPGATADNIELGSGSGTLHIDANGIAYRSIDHRFNQDGSLSSAPSSIENTDGRNHHHHHHYSSSASAMPSGNNFRSTNMLANSDRFTRQSQFDRALEEQQCSAPDGRTGHCYDASECVERGGVPMGRCSASGSSGVCCLFEATCGDTISEKHVYFRSPNYPATFDASQLCRLKVNKSPSGPSICQIKLNMIEFDIAKPVEGNCTQDIFSVSGQNENNIIPRICGYNSGQHYYLAVDESGLINLQLVFRGSYQRRFDIHIEQIECESKNLAPPYCLQYFDKTQGTIKSFNYDTRNGGEERGLTDSAHAYEGYPNNIDYLICIRKETGFCSVSYEYMSDVTGAVMPFSVGTSGLSGSRTETMPFNRHRGSQSRFAPVYASENLLQSENCKDDFLIVGGVRVCTIPIISKEDDTDDDHVTIATSTSTSTVTSSTIGNLEEYRISSTTGIPTTERNHSGGNNDTSQTNSDSHERLDESAISLDLQQNDHNPTRRSSPFSPPENVDSGTWLRRPHRRAKYHYYFGDATSFSNDQLVPRYRGATTNRQQQQPHGRNTLMATDWTPGPFQLRFVANGVNNARGFYLAYRQNPCKI